MLGLNMQASLKPKQLEFVKGLGFLRLSKTNNSDRDSFESASIDEISQYSVGKSKTEFDRKLIYFNDIVHGRLREETVTVL